MNDTIADAELVVAARGGDQRALEALVGRYLPLVYNIIGRALPRGADVDDVVQDTMLNVVRGLPGLRDERAFRSWLVAVAMNQIRRNRNAPTAHARSLDEAAAVADPGADFADLTLTELDLSGQRRETVEASRWLEEDDRELLSLWWLVTTGHLTRRELVDAMQLESHHVTVRVSRMKAQLDTARMVVRALTAVPRCPELGWTAALWDGRPCGLWRKRIARHLRECGYCGSLAADLIPAERLLVNFALVPVPVGLAAYVLTRAGHAAAVPSAAGTPTAARPRPHRGGPGPKHRASQAPHAPRSHRAPGRGHALASLTGKPVIAAAAFAATVTAALGIGSLVSPDQQTSAQNQPTGFATADDSDSSSAPASTAPRTDGTTADARPLPSHTTADPTSAGGRIDTAQPLAARHTTPAPAPTTPSHSVSPLPRPAPDPTAETPEQVAADQVLAVINQARAEQNLPPLQMSTGLLQSSAAHTRTMAAGCGLSHQCPGEPALGDRETAAGVHWSSCGENIGDGGPVADTTSAISDMAVGLTKSMLAEQPPDDGHRRNILSADFHHIGITVLRDSNGTVWMTQDFSD